MAGTELEDGYHRLCAAPLFRTGGVIEADVFGFVDELPDEARALPG